MTKKTLVSLLLLILFLPARSFAQTRPDAVVEYRNGNYQRAVEICTDELRENRNNMEAHVVICWSLIQLGRYGEARVYALEGRNISRFDPRIAEILGEVSYFQGQNDDALQYFQECINLASDHGRIETAYYYMGEIYIRQGRFRHADIALSTAVHYSPGNASWWSRLAYARENAGRSSGDLQEALAAYERALTLNPQLPDARRGLDRIRQALAAIRPQ
jgi:tetratricopeptide (TPR) repeat protein